MDLKKSLQKRMFEKTTLGVGDASKSRSNQSIGSIRSKARFPKFQESSSESSEDEEDLQNPQVLVMDENSNIIPENAGNVEELPISTCDRLEASQMGHSRHSIVRNSQTGGNHLASNRVSSVDSFQSNALSRFIEQIRLLVQQQYSQRVTYKLATLLSLLTLTTYGMTIGVFMFLSRNVFSSLEVAVRFQAGTIFSGLIALWVARLLSNRHLNMQMITRVLGREANFQSIVIPSGRDTSTMMLIGLAMAFNVVLVVCVSMYESAPVLRSVGLGFRQRLSLEPSTVVLSNETSVFAHALGKGYSCWSCSTFSFGDNLIVPVSRFLQSVDKKSSQLKKVLIYENQDVIGINVDCFTLVDTRNYPRDPRITFRVRNVIWGVNSSSSEYDIFTTKDGTTFVKRCRSVLTDRRAKTTTAYEIRKKDHVTQTKVSSLEPVDPKSCILYDSLCLNYSSRKELSYTLLNAALTKHEYLIGHGSHFPNPSYTNVRYFEKELQQFISNLLLISAGRFCDEIEETEIFSDQAATRLQIPMLLTVTVMVMAGTSVVLTVLIIGIDLIQLERVPNSLLRRLGAALIPGRHMLSSISKLLSTVGEDDDWSQIFVLYGEDRTTVDKEKGTLRFGRRKEIVKFKESREYHST
jgi:hypothetical protein